ncbi:MAG: DUF192 domain-containing protein [Lentisphaeria bacterium]|nr:DUF192 domain-containing protein [Lentisphaeria bacterium]
MLVKIKYCIVLSVLCFFAALSCHAEGGKTANRRPVYWPLTINGYLYDQIELAFTEAEQSKGLMNRDKLAETGGMLFVSDTMSRKSFWMKGCRFDLDLIYIDAQGVIVAMHRMKMEKPQQRNESEEAYYDRLPTYDSGKPAQFVLELAAGQIDFLGLQVGDKLDIGVSELLAMYRKFH